MKAKRIIPCLDIDKGRVVKGTNFVDLKDAGDPVELAVKYAKEGADELIFLDISGSQESRELIYDLVKSTSQKIDIPLTVGGGLKNIEDIEKILTAGADKVSINTAAVKNPLLVKEAAEAFGSKRIMVAVDVRFNSKYWEVHISGGKKATGKDVLAWVKELEELGAGEILLTSMDRDGTKAGYDLELTRKVSEAINIPVIASGGVGNLKHLLDGLTIGKADGVLAASIFHYSLYTILEAKKYLAKNGVPVFGIKN